MSKWWERLGIGVSPTQGEQKMSVVGNEAWLKAQDITDARRLIESGKATGDNEMIETPFQVKAQV